MFVFLDPGYLDFRKAVAVSWANATELLGGLADQRAALISLGREYENTLVTKINGSLIGN